MKTILLSRDMVHTGNLILVNREYPIYEEACEKPLVAINEGSNKVLLELQTAVALHKLLTKVNSGEQIVPISGFRSKDAQTQIYQTSIFDNGVEFTEKYVALPNHSEHQTGLAIDLALNQTNIDFLCPYFPYAGICGTFRSKAMQFGFIERYPVGKESITGIAHEPWHFRYVGAPHSQIMWDMDATLEEYLLMLKEVSYIKHFIDGMDIEVFYIVAEKKEVMFELKDDSPYTVSGDNMDGYIITVWR